MQQRTWQDEDLEDLEHEHLETKGRGIVDHVTFLLQTLTHSGRHVQVERRGDKSVSAGSGSGCSLLILQEVARTEENTRVR